MVSDDEKAILMRGVSGYKSPTQMTVKELLVVYQQLQKVAIDRQMKHRFM